MVFPDHERCLTDMTAFLGAGTDEEEPVRRVCDAARLVLRMYAENPTFSVQRYRLTKKVPGLRAYELSVVWRYERALAGVSARPLRLPARRHPAGRRHRRGGGRRAQQRPALLAAFGRTERSRHGRGHDAHWDTCSSFGGSPGDGGAPGEEQEDVVVVIPGAGHRCGASYGRSSPRSAGSETPNRTHFLI